MKSPFNRGRRSLPPRSYLVWLLLVTLPLAVHTPAAPSAPPKQRMPYVVLQNGRILRGDPRRDGSNIVITTENGGVVRIPIDRIRVVAASLNEAYRLQLNALSGRDLAAHVELCEWCLRQGLYREATELLPLLRHLRLTDDRLESLDRRIHSSLQAQIRRANNPLNPLKTVSKPDDPARTAVASARAVDSDIVSLQTRVAFSKNVLPILLNRCSAGGCHGKSGNGLLVQRPPNGQSTSRRLAERNLSLLGVLLAESPESPTLFLQMAVSEHGKGSNPVKESGAAARNLRDWIAQWQADTGIGRPAASLARLVDDEATDDERTDPGKKPLETKSDPKSDQKSDPMPTAASDPYDPADFKGSDDQSR